MGCDIHMVLEQHRAGFEWLGVWCSDISPSRNRDMVAQRDYGLFAEVAQVRGRSDTGIYPRNLPIDVSRLAWMQFMQAPTDHHSPSWLTLAEFIHAFNRANPDGRRDGYRSEHAAYDLFGITTDWPEDCEYRVVFWFDN